MKKLLSAIVVLSLAGAASAQQVEVGAGVGYKGGLFVEGTVHAPNVAGGLGLRGDVGYSQANKEETLYKVNANNITLGAGATYPLIQDPRGLDAYVHGGVRYNIQNIDYKEKLQDKTVVSASHNAFGVGGGVQVSYPVARNVRVTGDLGADHFFKGTTTARLGNLTAEQKDKVAIGTVFKARVGVKTSF